MNAIIVTDGTPAEIAELARQVSKAGEEKRYSAPAFYTSTEKFRVVGSDGGEVRP